MEDESVLRSCPNCDIMLQEIDFEGQRVDRCEQCHGMYFDAGELESIVNMMELFAQVRLDEKDIPSVPDDELARRVICPNDRSPMRPNQIGLLTFDACDSCGGIWLDGGELSALKMAEKHIKDNLNLYIRLGQ